MAIFSEKVLRDTKEVFEGLRDPLVLALYSRDDDCEHCSQAERFAEELVAVDDRLSLERKELTREAQRAAGRGIHHAPALVVRPPGEEREAVRYYGVPGGYEFGAFLRVLVLFSSGALEEKIDTAPLKTLEGEVNVKVFVLTSCPSCPLVAYLCAALAFLNPRITTEVIEANTFEDMATRFSVKTVPKIVINDSVEITGVPAPSEVIARIAEA